MVRKRKCWKGRRIGRKERWGEWVSGKERGCVGKDLPETGAKLVGKLTVRKVQWLKA